MVPTCDDRGYWLRSGDGGVFSFGDAAFYGSMGGKQPHSLEDPIVGMVHTPDCKGYWLVAADGGVFTFGDAGYFGSAGGRQLSQPVVGMATMPDGRGYRLVAADGGVFSFGDAGFYGSAIGALIDSPVAGLETTPDGKGYYEVTSDGSVLSFGDARFAGALSGTSLNAPVVAMATTRDARGYWLAAADGGVFAFGDASFHGSTPLSSSDPLADFRATVDGRGYYLVTANGTVTASGDAKAAGSMTARSAQGLSVAWTARGSGYWFTGSDGGVFSFGDARFYGSLGGSPSLAAAREGSPITLPQGRVVSAADPLRVDVIGDSVMYDEEPALAAALAATGTAKVVTNYSFGGWGLTSDPTWRMGFFSSIIAADHPDLVVGTWSWDTPAAQSDPAGYANLVDQALALLLAPGNGVSGVIFFEFPKSGSNPAQSDAVKRITAARTQETGRTAWNSVVNGLVTQWPGKVMFLPLDSSLEVNGHYSAWLPEFAGNWVRARKMDNAHVCPLGAADYAAQIVAEMAPVFHLPPPEPGWFSGSWTGDPRYNDPPGTCASDSPTQAYLWSLAPNAPLTSQYS